MFAVSEGSKDSPACPSDKFNMKGVKMAQWLNETGEKPRCLGKACPSCTLSTTNLAWTYLGSNPSLRDVRPATGHLSQCTSNKINMNMYYMSI